MIHVSILGSCMVIVNSLEVALDLLEKRGSIYSSRRVSYRTSLSLLTHNDINIDNASLW